MRREVSSLGRSSVYLLPLPAPRHTGCSCSCRPSRKAHIEAHIFPESDTRHSLGGLTWIFPGPLLTLILTFSAVPNNSTVHTHFHISFFKHEKEEHWGQPSSRLPCSVLHSPSRPASWKRPKPAWRVKEVLKLFFFPATEQRDMIPNIKNTYFYQEGIILLKNLTKTSSAGSTLNYIFLS